MALAVPVPSWGLAQQGVRPAPVDWSQVRGYALPPPRLDRGPSAGVPITARLPSGVAALPPIAGPSSVLAASPCVVSSHAAAVQRPSTQGWEPHAASPSIASRGHSQPAAALGAQAVTPPPDGAARASASHAAAQVTVTRSRAAAPAQVSASSPPAGSDASTQRKATPPACTSSFGSVPADSGAPGPLTLERADSEPGFGTAVDLEQASEFDSALDQLDFFRAPPKPRAQQEPPVDGDVVPSEPAPSVERVPAGIWAEDPPAKRVCVAAAEDNPPTQATTHFGLELDEDAADLLGDL